MIFIGRTHPSTDDNVLFSTWNKTDGTVQQPVNVSGNPIIRAAKDAAVSSVGPPIRIVWSAVETDAIRSARSDYIPSRPSETPPVLTTSEGSEIRGITPDIQARDEDYYVVWRNPASRIMLYSHRKWRLRE